MGSGPQPPLQNTASSVFPSLGLKALHFPISRPVPVWFFTGATETDREHCMQETVFRKSNQVVYIFIRRVGGKRAGQTPAKISHKASQVRILPVLLPNLAHLVPLLPLPQSDPSGFDTDPSPRGSCPTGDQSCFACCCHPSSPP